MGPSGSSPARLTKEVPQVSIGCTPTTGVNPNPNLSKDGRPAAGVEFVKRLEAERQRRLLPQKREPKAKAAPDERQMSLLAGSFGVS